MKKLMVVLATIAVFAAMALPSHAFTTIASCTGSPDLPGPAGMDGGCTSTFVALGNFDTTHVRFQPDFFFLGQAFIQIFEVGNPSNTVFYDSTWLTGRVQLRGPKYSGPYQLLAGHTYTLIVTTRADFPPNGPVGGTDPLDDTGVHGFVEV